MRKLKIVQLACYRGNVGDNANIVGTRTLLNQNLPFEIEYTDLDLMDFIWGFKKYDNQFIELVNQHDLLIIGGGGFFELTVYHTCTGTPLDISVDVLKKISTPIVFYSLGVDAARGVTEERLAKFRKFLDFLLSSEKILVSVRNDGAMDTVRRLLGDNYADRMYKVPDGGFFTVVKDLQHPELPSGKTVIGINLAGDMLDFRFPSIGGNSIGLTSMRQRVGRAISALQGRDIRANYMGVVDQFMSTLSSLMREYLVKHDDIHLVLIPHIYKDLDVINMFISSMAQRGAAHCRRRVSVAPYAIGMEAQDYIFDLYRKCDLVMGMRFHTNVCGIGLTVPTIGFITYPQIEKLYQDLGLSDRAIRVNEMGFEKRLASLIDDSLSNPDSIKEKFGIIRGRLLEETNSFHDIIRDLLMRQQS